MAAVASPAAAATVGRSARRVATFITADVAQSELAPAADGQLPDLQLTEQDKKAKKQASASTMQWRIVILVSASLTLSVLMMMDFDKGETRSTQADLAREDIKRKYIGSEDKPLEEYQVYLRKALVAHSSGESKTEKMYYRRVLGLLRGENFERDPERKGLTGIRDEPDDKDLPNDKNLEMLLNILISSK